MGHYIPSFRETHIKKWPELALIKTLIYAMVILAIFGEYFNKILMFIKKYLPNKHITPFVKRCAKYLNNGGREA